MECFYAPLRQRIGCIYIFLRLVTTYKCKRIIKSLPNSLFIRISWTALPYTCINCNKTYFCKWYYYLLQYISYWQPISRGILETLYIIPVIDDRCIDDQLHSIILIRITLCSIHCLRFNEECLLRSKISKMAVMLCFRCTI